MVAGVGSGPPQYQWTVLRLTSLAQVRSSGLDFAKILSRKLNSSMSIWGAVGLNNKKKKTDVKNNGRESNELRKVYIYYMTGMYTGRI